MRFGAAMVTDSKREELPLFVAPSGRNGETEEELAGGFLRRFAGVCVSDPMQTSRGKQNSAENRIAEGRGGVGALHSVEKGDGDAGSLRSAAHMRIDSASRGAQAGQCGGFDAAMRGQPGTPNIPEAGLAESELAIGFEAFAALAFNEFLPEFQRVFRFVGVGLLHCRGEDIEIVNFSEHVLKALEVIAPGGIVLGEETFDGVSEMLESNAQCVPGFGLFGAQRLGVKLPGAFESFERQAFGGETADRQKASALAKGALETLPGFLVEFGGGTERMLAQLRFVGFERSLQICSDGVAFRSEFHHPLFHHLRIAKCAEAAEEFAGDLAHGGPSGIWINFFHHCCDGPASAYGYTKIVDGVGAGAGGRADVFQLLDDAVHPEGKAAVLRAGTGGKSDYARHVENPARTPSNVPGREGTPVEGRVEYLAGNPTSSGRPVEKCWRRKMRARLECERGSCYFEMEARR